MAARTRRKKSKRDELLASIKKRLQEMAPENCKTIEEAVRNDQILSEAFGTRPSTAEDYSYCPTCGRVRWHGTCSIC